MKGFILKKMNNLFHWEIKESEKWIDLAGWCYMSKQGKILGEDATPEEKVGLLQCLNAVRLIGKPNEEELGIAKKEIERVILLKIEEYKKSL